MGVSWDTKENDTMTGFPKGDARGGHYLADIHDDITKKWITFINEHSRTD